jgi:1,4-dihydroxy-2-naphthoate octaprenyltransferase
MSLLAKSPRLTAWYRAARPRTLTATYAPLGLAAIVAIDRGVFAVIPFILALVAALLLQIAANLINEYADFRQGADEHKEAGQGMVIKQQVLRPQDVLIGAISTTLGGILIGLVLIASSGPLLIWIGAAGVLTVVAYTAGPYPLAYHGLGELAVFVCMGPLLVLGVYYAVSGGQYSPIPLVAGLPLGFMVAAILHANNIRDIDADRAVNKRTLAVHFGLAAARKEYAFLVIGAYVMVVILILFHILPWPTLIVFGTFPEAYRLMQIINTETETAKLHMAQGRTAKLHGAFGLWLVIGWGIAILAGSLLAG